MGAAITRRLGEVFGERVDGVVSTTARLTNPVQPHIAVILPWDMVRRGGADALRVAEVIGEVIGRPVYPDYPAEWVRRGDPGLPARGRLRFPLGGEPTSLRDAHRADVGE